VNKHRHLGFRSIEAFEEPSEAQRHVIPEDLLQYGLIPEFVGRLPVAVMLEALDEDTLVKIMTEPKNAIVKQYKKFFDLDKVELVFTQEAIRATAREALKHKTGARGLRTIVEEVLLDVMYEIPSRQDIRRCKITEKVILKEESPSLEPVRLAAREEEELIVQDEPA
jgi:ATP-dependent Clp protease ATP-binding subunit ClpX